MASVVISSADEVNNVIDASLPLMVESIFYGMYCYLSNHLGRDIDMYTRRPLSLSVFYVNNMSLVNRTHPSNPKDTNTLRKGSEQSAENNSIMSCWESLL
jgi:hypothetical protein